MHTEAFFFLIFIKHVFSFLIKMSKRDYKKRVERTSVAIVVMDSPRYRVALHHATICGHIRYCTRAMAKEADFPCVYVNVTGHDHLVAMLFVHISTEPTVRVCPHPSRERIVVEVPCVPINAVTPVDHHPVVQVGITGARDDPASRRRKGQRCDTRGRNHSRSTAVSYILSGKSSRTTVIY